MLNADERLVVFQCESLPDQSPHVRPCGIGRTAQSGEAHCFPAALEQSARVVDLAAAVRRAACMVDRTAAGMRFICSGTVIIWISSHGFEAWNNYDVE